MIKPIKRGLILADGVFNAALGLPALLLVVPWVLMVTGLEPGLLLGMISYVSFYWLAVTVLSDPAIYPLVVILAASLLAVTLLWSKPDWKIAGLLTLALTPFIVYSIAASSYEPALVGQAGYETIVVTEPSTAAERIVRTAWVSTEVQPCTYDLLGWADSQELIYRSQCGATTDVWSATPARQGDPRRIGTAPANLSGTAISSQDALEFVQTQGVSPASAEMPTRRIYLVDGEILRSPDGEWIALISKHLYGPHDVLILRRAS